MTATTNPGQASARPPRHRAPRLPSARGPVSDAVLAALLRRPGRRISAPAPGDPWGEDAQAAMYIAYELRYRGFAGVDPAWEWDPELLRLLAVLEGTFLAGLREAVGPVGSVEDALAPVLAAERPDATGVSQHLLAFPDIGRFREYAVHRSLYQLKEADPQALLIPRLAGRAKAAVVAVEFDEFGGGRAERVHARLYADLMRGLGLDDTYGAWLDAVPAPMLTVVNVMSLFGWHRAHRGMAAGHFAAAEASTSPAAARLAAALDRLGVRDPACARFYTEHIEADAVHEQLMRREVLGGLLDDEPELADDIAFGVRAATLVEDRFAAHLLDAWASNRSSLRHGVEPPAAPRS